MDPAALGLMGRHAIINWGSNPPIDWNGETTIVVASGPSAAATDFELLRGRRVIVVNRSWELAPWADVLFGLDGQFWFFHDGVQKFAGRKVTCSPMAAQSFGIDCLFCDGNNSGLRAIYLAEAFGSQRILLVGFDMHVNAGVHWHEPYDTGTLHNPTRDSAKVWREQIHQISSKFLKRGIQVINCTPGSALECFPRASLDEALNGDNAMARRADQSRCCSVP